MTLDCTTTADRIATAAKMIREHWPCEAKTAVILGTGLGELADEIDPQAVISYDDIPGFTRSTALAHKGRLVGGELHDQPVIFLQGRCHLYEGYSPADVCFPVRVLAALGIQTLVVTNAAGGLNPDYVIGDVMQIDDHIDLLFRPGAIPAPSTAGRIVRPSARLYDRELAAIAQAAARLHGFPLRQGVYVAVSGPCYETRAEYRAFRRLGADCVGMSTVPEVLAAASAGVRVLGLSTVTNVACPDAPKKVSAEEVVAVATIARPRIRTLLEAVMAACR